MNRLKINGDVGILHTTYLDNKFIDAEYKKLLERVHTLCKNIHLH